MKNDLLLLTTAAIWGFAFVAQRSGMAFIGPHTYNALRFLLGALSLFPLFLCSAHGNRIHRQLRQGKWVDVLLAGLFLLADRPSSKWELCIPRRGKQVLLPVFMLFWFPCWEGSSAFIAGNEDGRGRFWLYPVSIF